MRLDWYEINTTNDATRERYRMDGRTDGRTDGQKDGRMQAHTKTLTAIIIRKDRWREVSFQN